MVKYLEFRYKSILSQKKTELIITTNRIPASLSPINNIANGTHATLGNDCSPTANELIVFPKPGNLTITKPIVTPIVIDTKSNNKSVHCHSNGCNQSKILKHSNKRFTQLLPEMALILLAKYLVHILAAKFQ
jgi:hypothetical protein